MATKSNDLDFSLARPHSGQMKILESFEAYPVTVLSPGRQYGKSSLRPFWIMDVTSYTPGFATLAYMGPAHSDAEKAYDEDLFNLKHLILDSGGKDQDRHIDYRPIDIDYPREHIDPNDPRPCVCTMCSRVTRLKARMGGRRNEGTRVYYVSGGPDAHRLFQKHKLHGAFIDEFSHVAFAAWFETIRPMFNTTGGHALIVGTPIPEGINFTGFADVYNLGVKGHENYNPRYNSISGSSFDNPYANREEIQEQINDLIKMGRGSLVRCLYYGEFVTDLGAVFTNLDAVFVLKAKEVEPGLWVHRPPRPGEAVVVSIDFGRHDDSTVVMAFSRDTLEQLALQRIQRTDYLVQIPMIARFVARHGRPQIWAEGREETAAELLRQQFGNACGLVKWTSGGVYDKSSCVARGMDLCQRGGWTLIDVEWQKNEFRLFERQKKVTNGVTRWSYNAPEGKHDDSVAAALYATYGLPLVAPKPRAVPPDPDKRDPSMVFSQSRRARMERALPFVLRRQA